MRRRRFCLALAAAPIAAPLAGLAGLGWPSAGARAQSPAPDMAVDFVRRALDRVIIPDYERFAAATEAFAGSAAGGCADIETLRAGFHDAMDAWQAVQAVRFGPVEREERHFRIQFWPDKRNLTARHLGQFIQDADESALAPETLAAHSIAVQGFPALERLLFEDAEALTAGNAEADFRCRLVAAIARNLANIAAAIVAEWPEDRRLMTAPGPKNPTYRDGSEALRAIHGAMSGGLDAVVMLKLEPVLGDGPEDVRARLAENWRSARSLRNIALNLRSADRLFRADGAADYSFDAFLRASELGRLADRIGRGLTDGADRARDIGPDFATAFAAEGGYTGALLLRDQVGGARAAVSRELAAALGLTLGFNALDGD